MLHHLVQDAEWRTRGSRPSVWDVWESLPVPTLLHPSVVWDWAEVLALAALAAQQRGSAQGDGGSWVGWGHAVPVLPAPHTHSRSFCHIFRGLFFIPDAISSSAGADGCPLREETLVLCPEWLLHGHQPLSMVGQDPPAPQPSPQVQLQCWKGAGTCQSPWHGLGTWRLGWGGGGVILFCSSGNTPCGCPTAAGAERGDYFLSGQRVACQMRVRLITLF